MTEDRIAHIAILRSLCARLQDERCTTDELRVVDEVFSGLEHGREVYGPLDLTRDDRDFDGEAAAECRDMIAYLAMRKVAAQHKRIQRLHRELHQADFESTGIGLLDEWPDDEVTEELGIETEIR